MKVKIKLQDKEVEASEVPLDVVEERWAHYALNDGVMLKIKPVVLKVFRIDGQFSPEGDPLYSVNNVVMVVVTNVPEHLRKQL